MSNFRTTITTQAEASIDSGNHYFAMYSATANDTDLIEVRFATPDTNALVHMEFDIECALAATVALWEDTTKTDNATNRITPMNRNRNSTNTSVLTICHTPGGSQAGDADLLEYVGAAASGGRVAVGGEATHDAYFILKRNSAYLIRVTSRADLNALAIILDWYEE